MKSILCILALFACASANARALRPAQTPGGRPAPVERKTPTQLGQKIPAPAAQKIPSPALVWKGFDANATGSDGKPYVGITLGVSNYAQFPEALFAPAPGLPPCGDNKSASRSWLRVVDARTGREVYSYCAMAKPVEMRTFSFNVERQSLPAEVYVHLEDRSEGARHGSNCLRTVDGKPCVSTAGASGGGLVGTEVLAQPSVSAETAFFAVHGREPNPEEAKFWRGEILKHGLTQEALVRRVLERLTTNPDVFAIGDMKFIVQRAFQAAGKGWPAEKDYNYWTNRIMARTAYYQIILDALKK